MNIDRQLVMRAVLSGQLPVLYVSVDELNKVQLNIMNSILNQISQINPSMTFYGSDMEILH